jgi:hypothetical protein
MERPQISFDQDGKLRVLDAEIYKQTEELEKEARAFVASESSGQTATEVTCVSASLGDRVISHGNRGPRV